jgi:hypothetical protein
MTVFSPQLTWCQLSAIPYQNYGVVCFVGDGAQQYCE